MIEVLLKLVGGILFVIGLPLVLLIFFSITGTMGFWFWTFAFFAVYGWFLSLTS
jgi:hypothetical protein